MSWKHTTPVVTEEELFALMEKYSDGWTTPTVSEAGWWNDNPNYRNDLLLGGATVKGCHFYNNGKVNIRRREHPGEGWVRGRLPYNRPNKDPQAVAQKMREVHEKNGYDYRRKPITIDGVTYPSKKEAMKALGIKSTQTFWKRYPV